MAAAAAGVVAGSILIVTAFLILTVALFFPPVTAALRLPVARLIRATNSRPGADGGSAPLGLAAFSMLDPAHPVARACGSTGRPSRSVLAWRVLGILLAAASLTVSGAVYPGFRGDPPEPPAWFLAFFTNWTFILFLGTTLVGSWVSGAAVWRDRQARRLQQAGKSAGDAAGAATTTAATTTTATPLATPRSSWTLPAKLHVLATACLTPTTLFITAFYWGALFPAMRAARPSADAILKHGINAGWALGDALLSRTPACTAHFPVLAAYVFTYIVFMWAYSGSTGKWMYGVLAWREGPRTLGVYAALPALLAACAGAWVGIAAAREAVCVRRACGGCGGGGRARRRDAAADTGGGGGGGAAV